MVLLNFWYKLSITSKILLVAVVFLLGWGLKMSYYKYKYFKVVESERNELLLKKELSDLKIDSLLVVSKNITKKVKTRSNNIDKKHKKDVEEINNIDVTNDELNSFISKHSN